MNETGKTVIFVAVAVLAAGAAWVSHRTTAPPSIKDANIGKEFFEEFNPADVTAITIVDFEKDKATVDSFEVVRDADRFGDDRLHLSEFNDYPADKTEKLAETAASVNRLKRGALRSRRSGDWANLGVIDPLADGKEDLDGRGQRLTLMVGDEKVFDLIIGKQVGDSGDNYYVRKPDEDKTYIAEVKLEISTKFKDWVDQDLLDLDRDDLVRVNLDRSEYVEVTDPIFNTVRLQFKEAVVDELTRSSSSEDWKLLNLNEETEELENSKLNTLAFSLEDLEIIGVRPKPQGIQGDLSLNVREDIKARAMQILNQQLVSYGFFLTPGGENKPRLLSKEGELVAGTGEGVEYHLHFGNQFQGTDEDIQIGSKDDTPVEEESKDKKSDSDDDSSDGDSSEDASDDSDEELVEGRYVYLRVVFNPAHIGEKPVKPTEPVKPEGYDDWKQAQETKGTEEEKKDDASKDEDADAGDAGADAEEKGDDSAEEAGDETETEAESPNPFEEYEAALKQFEEDSKSFDDDIKTWNEKAENGQKKVAALNRRYEEWYYVIEAEEFEKLLPPRTDIVTEKEPEEPAESGDDGDATNDSTTNSNPDGDAVKPDDQGTGSPTTTDGDDKSKAGESPVNSDEAPAKPDEAKPADKTTEDNTPPAPTEEKVDDGGDADKSQGEDAATDAPAEDTDEGDAAADESVDSPGDDSAGDDAGTQSE